jgi:hypothetical protein
MEQGAPMLCPCKTGAPEKARSDQTFIGLTASSEIVIKSWKPRIIPPPFRDGVVIMMEGG